MNVRDILVTSGIYSFITTLALGVFVYTRNRKNPLNIYFGIFALTVSCWSIGSSLENMIEDETTALWVLRGNYLFAVFLPTFFIQFVQFVAGISTVRRKWTIGSYILSIGLVPFVFTDLFIRRLSIIEPYNFRISDPGPIYYIFIGFFSVVSFRILFLLYALVKNTEGIRRKQAQYLFITHVLLVSAGLEYFTRVLKLIAFPPLDDYILVLFFVFFAYAIIKERLMDIQTVIHKTAMWGVLSSLIILPVSGVFYFGHDWIMRLGPFQLSLLVAGLILLLIPYIKVIQPRIDHLFQRRKHDLQTILQDFIHEIAVLKSLDELVNKLQTTITSVLYPEKISIVLFDVKAESLTPFLVSNLPDSFSAESHDSFLKWLECENDIVEMDLIDHDPKYSEIRESAKSYFNDVQGKLVVPLTHDGKLLGVLNLDQKKNLKPYTEIDLDFLFNLKVEASISLSNSLLYNDVSKMSVELKQWATKLEHKVEERTVELEASNQKLEESYDKLQEYDRAKSRFFANISHELRTPTTFILGPVQMFINHELGLVTSEQEKYLRVIHRNGTRLLNIINKLMDLMKSESGQIELICQRSNFVKFVDDIVHSVIPVAEKKSLTLTFTGDQNIPEFFFDLDKMEEVLYNLLSNAFKFTQTGGITVSCLEQYGSVLVKVTDTGCGIPTDSLEKVFERFYQVDNEASRVGMGTGIGLSLVKDWVELHEGRVWVTSEERKGSTILFTIPIQTQERVERPRLRKDGGERRERERRRMMEEELALDSVMPQESPSRAEEGFERILIVDDMPDMLTFISDHLKFDYDCCFAKDGAQGINRARVENPDLIISDVMMPVKDGYQLCRELKSDPQTASIPIILLTAKGSLSDKIEGLEEGADDYLTKPFNQEELKVRVRTLLKTRRLQKELQITNKRLEESMEEIRRTGRQLMLSEKMAALGLLTAGMAHEIRNPVSFAKGAIGIVKGYLGKMAEQEKGQRALRGEEAVMGADALLGLREDAIMSLGVIEEGLNRTNFIVSNLDYFVRAGEGFTAVDIRACLDATLGLLRHAFGERVAVHRDDAGATGWSPLPIEGISGQINQAFMNILQNANQSIETKGEIFITTRKIGEAVTISMRDTGRGIAESDLSKVFEPFYTTKGVGEGTGLGMAIVYKIIVENHHGTIDIKSRLGEGTEVVITLPQMQQKE